MNKNSTMKDLPESDRPYEKCLAKGPGVLSDAELLAVLLRTGGIGRTSLDIARDLLQRFDGLPCLMRLSPEELRSVPGIGPVKAVELLAAGEISRRIARTQLNRGDRFETPESLASYFMEEMRHLGQEQLQVVMLSTKSRMLHHQVVTIGTVTSSMAPPREIFLEALRRQAVNLVVLHNHPSGDPTPSAEDVRVTERLVEAGKLIGIPVVDHIVIGDKQYYSFRQHGLID